MNYSEEQLRQMDLGKLQKIIELAQVKQEISKLKLQKLELQRELEEVEA